MLHCELSWSIIDRNARSRNLRVNSSPALPSAAYSIVRNINKTTPIPSAEIDIA